MWPPRRVEGVTARSRLTRDPGARLPRVVRSSVSCETSAENPSAPTSRAVRQTPLTAMESPSAVPAAVTVAPILTREPPPVSTADRIVPSSSIIPVNTDGLEPGLFVCDVGLDELLVGFRQVHDAFNYPDHGRDEKQRKGDAACYDR